MANQSLGRDFTDPKHVSSHPGGDEPASWGRGGSSNVSTQATSQGSSKITLGGLHVDIDY